MKKKKKKKKKKKNFPKRPSQKEFKRLQVVWCDLNSGANAAGGVKNTAAQPRHVAVETKLPVLVPVTAHGEAAKDELPLATGDFWYSNSFEASK